MSTRFPGGVAGEGEGGFWVQCPKGWTPGSGAHRGWWVPRLVRAQSGQVASAQSPCSEACTGPVFPVAATAHFPAAPEQETQGRAA